MTTLPVFKAGTQTALFKWVGSAIFVASLMNATVSRSQSIQADQADQADQTQQSDQPEADGTTVTTPQTDSLIPPSSLAFPSPEGNPFTNIFKPSISATDAETDSSTDDTVTTAETNVDDTNSTLTLEKFESEGELDETEESDVVEPESEKTEEEKLTEELDERLLGGWALLIKGSKAKLSDATARAAAANCATRAKLSALKFERDAEKALPAVSDFSGTVIYYRTSKGIQRLEVATGRVFLLNKMAREVLNDKVIVWGLRGKAAGYRLRFANTAKLGSRAQFMLEEDALYLRCRLTPRDELANQ